MLLREAIDVFNVHNVDVWLNYGTMLGAVRNEDIIMHENDNDIGIMDKDCKGLKAEFFRDLAKVGLAAYNRSVEVPDKKHLVWDHQQSRFGYSSPYLHMPCLRIFDQRFHFYIDVYSYEEVPVEKARELHRRKAILLPPDYTFDEPLLCNLEGLDKDGKQILK